MYAAVKPFKPVQFFADDIFLFYALYNNEWNITSSFYNNDLEE